MLCGYRNSQSKYLSSGTDASKESDAKDSRRREVLCIKEGNLPNKQREQLNKLIDERKFIERDVAYAKELQRKVNIEYKEYQLKMERQARKDSLRARQLQREEKDEYEKILQILVRCASHSLLG